MKIIGISGRKQAGKNTVANYINGYVLKERGMIEDFYINDNGQLAIKTSDMSGQTGYGIFDPTRKDSTFIEYAEKELWPYIKVYHFADTLKEMAINLFDIDPNLVYGNNNDKNQPTEFNWKDVPSGKNIDSIMSVREFLEYFGTGIIRKIKNDAWSSSTIKKIVAERSEISIIPDVRFPDEVEAIKGAGGSVIRLKRNVFNSVAEAECALDENNYDWNNFDLVIDNEDITISQMCELLNLSKTYWS